MIGTSEVRSKSSSFMNPLHNTLITSERSQIGKLKKKKDGVNMVKTEVQSKGGRL